MASTVFRVNASQSEHIPEGYLLSRMYYGTFLESVLSRDQYTGYPHNGGEHTLNLRLSLEDLKAFLDLVLETFKSHYGAIPFVHSIKARFAATHPQLVSAL